MATHLNAICFGGGGLVGTAKALGHLVGFDQIVREPSARNELKKSFFDYMAVAGVPLRELEPRLDEVFDRMPAHVRSTRTWLKTGNSSIAAASWRSMMLNEPTTFASIYSRGWSRL